MSTAVNPEAASLLGRLRAINLRAQALCGDLSAEQLRQSPASREWSIGSVLEHLLLSDGIYLEVLAPLTARARAQGKLATGRPWKPSLLGGLLERALRPTSRRKLPAPKKFRPGAEPRAEVLTAFLKQQGELAQRLEADADLDWRAIRMASPASPLVRINLGDAFHILVTHAERHLGQIERTRAALGLGAPA